MIPTTTHESPAFDGAVTTPDAHRPSRAVRVWRTPLAVHALVFGLVLVALAPFLHLTGSFISDEGAYAVQVHALERRTWAFSSAATAVDPTGRWFPYVDSTTGPRGTFTYVQHPVYPTVLRLTTRLLGNTVGLHLLPLLGALLTAVAAWMLARELVPGRERLAFWLAAASPVFVHATVIWAHTLSAAVSGFAVLAAVRILRRGLRPVDGLLLPAALAAGVLLRSEGLLFAAALVPVLGAALGWRRGLRAAVAPVILGAGAAALALVAEGRWIRHITGGVGTFGGVRTTPQGGQSYLTGRAVGAWHELFDAGMTNARAIGVGTIALVLLLLAGAAARSGAPGSARRATVLTGLATAVFVARVVLVPREPVTGILLAWPAAVWLVAGWRWDGLLHRARVVAAAIGVFLVLVVATEYSTGGAVEWGWRFASPALAPLAVLAAVSIRSLIERAPAPERRVLAVAMATSIAASALAGVVVVRSIRTHGNRVVAAVVAEHPQVVITTEEPLPRVAWNTDPGTAWLLVPRDELSVAVARLGAAGFTRVAVEGRGSLPPLPPAPFTRVSRPSAPFLRAAGFDLVVLEQGTVAVQ